MISRSKPIKRGDRAKAAKKRARIAKRQRHAELLVADMAARDAVFERDGFKCVRCARKTVQWAHIFSRRYRALRHLSDNALSLCGGCHLWWHHEPILATEWFRKTWPERYELLLAMRNLA